MATMTVQEIDNSGLTPSYSAAADGDVFANEGNEFLHVKNGGAGSITVTITPASPTKYVPGLGNMTKSTVSVAVAAGAEAMIGPFQPSCFNSSAGVITVNYSGVSSVTAAAIKLPVKI